MDDETFLRHFEDCTWPVEDWHHREHVKAAYLYLRRYPLDEVRALIRERIKRFNAAHHVPEAIDRGYHETVTQAWLQLIHFTLVQSGPAPTADEFFDAHPELWQFKVLRFFYSRDRLPSAEAKAMFLAADLTPLPSAAVLRD
jgi:hypothetical protein